MKFCDGEFEFTSTKMCQYLVFCGEPYPVYSGDCRMKKWGGLSSGHRLIWWGMRYRFAMNPVLHRAILRKSITFAYVRLRGNKSKLGLKEA